MFMGASLIILAGCAGYVAFEFAHARDGWEDERGFHLGLVRRATGSLQTGPRLASRPFVQEELA